MGQSSISPRLDRETILKHLETVLASPLFSRAERQRRFLEYVVRKAVDGRSDELKEYPIGVSVYDRPAGYDPREDPIVRVEASRLRARLREFYSAPGAGTPLRIELPKGSYVPEFVFSSASPEQEAAPPAPQAKGRQRWAAGALLALVLLLAAAWRLSRPSEPLNEQARIHYEKARQMHMLMTAESLRDALEEQRKAVDADPRSPLAQSGMAHILISLASIAGLGGPEDALSQIQPWISRSFELEKDNADAWAAVIRVRRDLELDFESAQAACQQALRLRPEATPIQINCAVIDVARGRHGTALATLEGVLRRMPTREAVLMTYAEALYLARRHQELVSHCRQVRKQSPSLWETYTHEAAGLVALGRAAEAVELLRGAPRLEELEQLRSVLAFALARAGQAGEAARWLERSQSNRARILLALGRRAEALDWLESEWSRRGATLWFSLADPAMEALAGEPRFERIRKGMRL
jgi:tetratricopeptide (TPR) repeat protein